VFCYILDQNEMITNGLKETYNLMLQFFIKSQKCLNIVSTFTWTVIFFIKKIKNHIVAIYVISTVRSKIRKIEMAMINTL
jgi:hypothetical protein